MGLILAFASFVTENLGKFYRKVKKCKNCGREYGIDTGEKKHKDLCPLCIDGIKGRHTKRRMVKIIEEDEKEKENG